MCGIVIRQLSAEFDGALKVPHGLGVATVLVEFRTEIVEAVNQFWEMRGDLVGKGFVEIDCLSEAEQRFGASTEEAVTTVEVVETACELRAQGSIVFGKSPMKFDCLLEMRKRFSVPAHFDETLTEVAQTRGEIGEYRDFVGHRFEDFSGPLQVRQRLDRAPESAEHGAEVVPAER
ncbi:hypothetical protein GCM10029992_07220 [Glycomyces albus]